MSNVHLTPHPQMIAVEMHLPHVLKAPSLKVRLQSASETTEQAGIAEKAKQGERHGNEAALPFDLPK